MTDSEDQKKNPFADIRVETISPEAMDEGNCSARAPYALQVLGDSMEPEFMDGCIIIVDPDHPYGDGAFVVIEHLEETTFRQFVIREERSYLVALNENYPDIEITGEYKILGVITQQARNRKRGLKRAKHYV